MKNVDENMVEILAECYPHRNVLELTRQGEWICLISIEITRKNKRVSFMTYIPEVNTTKKVVELAAGQMNEKLPCGKFYVEQKSGALLCNYTRTLASCFGYWHKKENYTILLGEGIKRLQELTDMIDKMIKEENNG